jgi:murein DD-endopeptidase MepM/ murein hydrolase activator NlpD
VHSSGKAKKSLFFGLLTVGAFSLLAIPLLASASFFSGLLGQTASASDISNASYNSQTLPLPAPALNIDPSQSFGGDLAIADSAALVPQEGPAGTEADIVNRPTTSQISVYTVHPGDTLSSIAAMFNVPVNSIVWANDIKNGIVQPGDQLTILPIASVQHTVLEGDTLQSLAVTYHSDVHDIAVYNSLPDTAALSVGQIILIPNGLPTDEENNSSANSSSGVGSGASASKTKNHVTSQTTRVRAADAAEPYLGGSGPAIPGYFAWPIAGGIVTQGLHGWNAVDIGAPTGTSIYAAAAGTVIVAKGSGAWDGGYGNYVVIQHPNGTQTLYAHMSRVIATVGESVAQGGVIGKVGQTGLATGPHLHFEVRGALNPFASLPLGASD